MKQLLLALLIFIFCNPLFAQTGAITQLELRIKENLFRKPDSAKIYLYRLLEHSAERHDTAVAVTYSNLGITYNQLADYDSSEIFIKKGIAISKEYPHTQANLYSNLAINYRTNAQYDKSLAALETAMELYKKLDNLNGEGLVYGEMASNFSYMLQKEKAINYLKKAIEIFKETEDPRLHILQQKLANAYYNNENYEFAVDLYEQILPVFAKNKGAPYYLTLLAYAESLVKINRIEDGEKRLVEAKAGLKEINNLEYMHVAWGKLGKIYKITDRPKLAETAFSESFNFLLNSHSTRFLEIASEYLNFLNAQGNYDKGLEVINKVQDATNNYKLAMNAGDELKFITQTQETYRKKGAFEHSLALFDRIDFLKDSLRNSEDAIKIKELEETYQNKIQREKNIILAHNNELLKDNNKRQEKITILSIALAVALLIMSVIIYKFHRKKLALQKSEMSNLELSNAVLKETQQLEKELLKEKEDHLGDKERELVAISLEVSDIQNQIKDLLDASNENEISKELSAKIVNILNQRNYWKHFKAKFVAVHPQFGYNLSEMFPELSEDDIAFCSLLKLQLTNKEIATLLGITHQSVISKKYRVKKKMHLQDNDESFEELMRDL